MWLKFGLFQYPAPNVELIYDRNEQRESDLLTECVISYDGPEDI